ncbi:hypothetical protein B0H14DRAFT_1192995 [Mycena olivaceomarginata]|nr:hypothetical protein B0H14DRAFT_1192995 [Mycena olivaceomarginata]
MQYTVDSEQYESSWNSVIEVFSKTGGALLLYGIYFNLFLLSVYTLSHRREARGTTFLVATSCAMAVVATTETAVNVADVVIIVRLARQLVNMQIFNRPATLERVQYALSGINYAVTDTFFMYRCYVIWGYQRKVLFLPALLMLATSLMIILSSFSGNTAFGQIACSLAAVANLLLTALTAGRILWIRRQSFHVGLENTHRRRYNRAIAIILESGAFYLVTAIFLLIIASQQDTFNISLVIGQQILSQPSRLYMLA